MRCALCVVRCALCVVCGVWCVECGVWSVECGVWCGVWCVVCVVCCVCCVCCACGVCCVVLCCVVLCCVVLCCVVLCCVVLCCVVLCCVVLCCVVLCCVVLCCVVLCCAVLCCAVLCCAVLCCAVLCCAALCCAALRCAALRCAALRCVAAWWFGRKLQRHCVYSRLPLYMHLIGPCPCGHGPQKNTPTTDDGAPHGLDNQHQLVLAIEAVHVGTCAARKNAGFAHVRQVQLHDQRCSTESPRQPGAQARKVCGTVRCECIPEVPIESTPRSQRGSGTGKLDICSSIVCTRTCGETTDEPHQKRG